MKLGLTLIELMIVVAIVGILALVAVPEIAWVANGCSKHPNTARCAAAGKNSGR